MNENTPDPRVDPFSAGFDEAEVPWRYYFSVVHKRRWTVIGVFLLIVGVSAAYTFTLTPIFEARTRLLIEADSPNVVSFAEVISEEQEKADYYQTQYNILTSRALARKTLESLKLWATPPFGGGGDAGFSITGALATAAAGVLRTFTSALRGDAEDLAANEAVAEDETAAQSRAIDVFLANVTVTPIRLSRLADVKYRSSDPTMAARIVNALAQNYIEENLEYKFTASKDANDWLTGQLTEQRQQVESAEIKLQQYREQNEAISLEDRENIVVQKLTDLNTAVTLARTERFQKEAALTQLKAVRGDRSALDSSPAVLSNAFIQQQKSDLARLQSEYAQLGERLGDQHPNMIKIRSAVEMTQARLDGEIEKIVASVQNEYQAALAKEQSLTAALNAQRGAALAMNRKAIDYNALERDVESSKQIYESLLQRAKETGISGTLRTSNIRVVDAAEIPRTKVSPRNRLNMLLAVFGGGMFALVLAFFFEHVDSRIKSPEEIRTHLGLPFLGLIPALNRKPLKGGQPLINKSVHFTEALRSIRTNVGFWSPEEGSRSLLVASAAPGEGKTTVSVNLAASFAQAGLRVLLIDADMRRPHIHDALGVAQEPGLSDFLLGNANASDVVRKTAIPGLWVLTSGSLPPNPAELLSSHRFKNFVPLLKKHFDWVIIDSPPVMAVTDAAIAGDIASGVLFVVGSEMTSRHVARTAVELLSRGRARFVGAVLNRVDLKRNAFYYSQYDRREYGAYYQQVLAGAAK